MFVIVLMCSSKMLVWMGHWWTLKVFLGVTLTYTQYALQEIKSYVRL